MRRIKLTVAYDGTNYCGWQVQPNGETIEGVLNRTLSELFKEPITVIGASRTDSGVHGCGNVAVFDTEARIPGEKVAFALNQRLPEDIRIQKSEEVEGTFHPRHCDTRKTYQYSIYNATFQHPLHRLYSHFVYRPLEVEKMRQAADYIVGTHDFVSFCSINTSVKDTVRTVYSLEVKKDGNLITIEIKGNGFLYNMVRIIAGTLIQVGLGQYPPEKVQEMLDAKNREASGPTAPANGLTLIEIEYL